MDPRLALAFDLLRSVMEQPGDGQAQADFNRPLPFVPPPFSQTNALSATDLLSWWFRPAATAVDSWDEYFTPPAPATQVQSTATHELNPWVTLRAMFPAAEEELADEHAEAAIECLYEFVHAIARRDVNGALELVADDYHALEEDREIDRLALRHQLEGLLDSLTGWELEASLVNVPEALPHPTGILVFAEIQIDAYRPTDDARKTIVTRRVAVFERQPGRRWLISALSPVSST